MYLKFRKFHSSEIRAEVDIGLYDKSEAGKKENILQDPEDPTHFLKTVQEGRVLRTEAGVHHRVDHGEDGQRQGVREGERGCRGKAAARDPEAEEGL